MKRLAAAIEPDFEPEVIEWDDPEVLDFEEDEPQFIGIRSENNPADLSSTDNADVPIVDYSRVGLPLTAPPLSPSEQTADNLFPEVTRPIVMSDPAPLADTGASQSSGPTTVSRQCDPLGPTTL